MPPSNPSSSNVDRWDPLRRLTSRDRLLLFWLAEHYVLTGAQIARALFPNPRTARQRLLTLYRMNVLTRWVDQAATGSTGYLYALGRLGGVLHPTAYADPDNRGLRPPRSHPERIDRLVGSQRLPHLLGVNAFFTDLHAAARACPQARLVRWWSEQHATAAYASATGVTGTGIRPDGHGIWQVTDPLGARRTVGWWLEHDRETEPVPRVMRKLAAYARLTRVGPTYPVLFHVPTARREEQLLTALLGVPAEVPVATAVHSDDPAGPVWTLAADQGRRRWLHELVLTQQPDGSWGSDAGPYRLLTGWRTLRYVAGIRKKK
jgi:hypothetical protein